MTTKDNVISPTLYIPHNFIRNNLPIDSTYQYEVLAPHHADRVVEVFTQSFCHLEPMTHYLKLDEVQYKTFAYAVTEKAIQDQCSIVALDGDTVVALALIEDLMDPGTIPDFDPKFKYILALLEQLGNNFFTDKTFNRRHIAHLFITAVHESYRRQGLSTQVNFHAMDLAQQQGFDFIYCEFTHFFNEKGVLSHLSNQKKLIGSQNYKDFRLNGEKPFANLEGGASAYLWEIKKDAVLKYKKNNQEIIETLSV